MGRVARWIDAQDDAAKDRIIEHPDPTFSGRPWWNEDRDCGCLVGCARRGGAEWGLWAFGIKAPVTVIRGGPRFDVAEYNVGVRFPDLCDRFTPERMWRVCKARAARRNRVELPAVAEELAVA